MSARAQIEAARPYRLDVYDAARANPRDMTDSISELPSFTNVGSLGEVSSATLFLDAAHGWHVTRGRPGRDGSTATGQAYEHERGYVIDQFTLMRLRVGRGTQTHTRFIEARALKPQFTPLGLFNTVEASCLEHSLKDIIIPGHWWFRTYREVLDELVAHYNSQRGARQPALRLLDSNIGDGVDLDRTTAGGINLYAGTDCFTAINLLVDRLRQPVQVGGQAEMVSAFYTDRGDAPSPGLDLHVVVQGRRGTSVPVIRSGEIRVSANLRQRLPAASNLTVLRGIPGSGTMPMSIAHWAGRTEAFDRAAPWASGVAYGAGQLVRHRAAAASAHHEELRWRARVAHTSSSSNEPPASGSQTTEWEPMTEWAYLRDGNDRVATDNWAYAARLTGGMWDMTKDDASQSYNEGLSSVSFPDSNLVVRDQDAWADWAHYRLSSGNIAHDAADGTRVLISGAAPTAMTNGQPSGLSTPADDNALVQRLNGAWFVMRKFPLASANDPSVYQVNVLREGRVYEWLGTRPAAAAAESWNAYDDYSPGYRVRHAATAQDAAANSEVTAGTEYVWERRAAIDSRYVRRSTLLPPPRDARRWALVGPFSTELDPDVTVPPGYGPARREWTGPRTWEDVSADGIVPNTCFHHPSRVALVEPLVRVPDGAPSPFARAVYVEYTTEAIFGGLLGAAAANSPLSILGTALASDEVRELAAAIGRLVAGAAGRDANDQLVGAGLDPIGADDDLSPQSIWKALSDRVRGVLDSPQGYGNLGWWYTLFRAPLPDDGSAYRPHFLDLNNRNATPSNARGWGAPDAEELGRLTGIRFDILFDKTLGQFRAPQGDLPFRCFLMDSESNVWVQDFAVRHLGVRQDVLLSFQNFKAYTARVPINVANYVQNAILPELRTLESLNRRQIKHIGLHLLTNYDEHGRFVPWWNPFHNLLETFTAVSGRVVHWGIIDNFCFVKSPIAVASRAHSENTGAEGRVIMSPVSEVPVSNTVQLRQAAEARAHLNAWRQDNFTVRVEGRADILAEQSVILEDPRLVTESDAAASGPAAWSSGEMISLRAPRDDRRRTHNGRVWQAGTREYQQDGTALRYGPTLTSTVPPGTGTAVVIGSNTFYIGSDMIGWRDVGAASGAGTLRLAVTRVSHSWQADGGGWISEISLARRINRLGAA